MKRIETRDHIKTFVDEHPDGISLTDIHNKVQRLATRLQVRTMLTALTKKNLISQKRTIVKGYSITMYYPFNGTIHQKRVYKMKPEPNTRILSMKDFNPRQSYQAFIIP